MKFIQVAQLAVSTGRVSEVTSCVTLCLLRCRPNIIQVPSSFVDDEKQFFAAIKGHLVRRAYMAGVLSAYCQTLSENLETGVQQMRLGSSIPAPLTRSSESCPTFSQGMIRKTGLVCKKILNFIVRRSSSMMNASMRSTKGKRNIWEPGECGLNIATAWIKGYDFLLRRFLTAA